MAAAESGVEGAINIGSRLELFVDRQLIDRMEQVELRLHEPQKLPLPVSPLRGDYATVIKDGDLYRAYYRGNDPGYKGKRDYCGHPGETTCYAESRDGHEWTFPSLGLFEVNGSRENNVVLAGQPPFSHNFSPFLDTRPGVAMSERFKALAGHPGYDRQNQADGLHSFASAGGIRWRKTSEEPVIPYRPSWPHAFDSQNVSFWSEAERLYVCYFRTWLSRHGALRTISRATSPDFVHWSEPVAMEPNLPGEHLYTSQTHPYFRAPHLYIALPTEILAPHWPETLAADDGCVPEFLTPPAVTRNRRDSGLPEEAEAPLQETARHIAASPALQLLARHCYHLLYNHSDYKAFGQWPDFKTSLGELGEVFYLLLLQAAAPLIRRTHAKLNIPEAITQATSNYRNAAEKFQSKNNGRWGFDRGILSWIRYHVAGKLFRIGRMEYKLEPFNGRVEAYRHKQTGSTLALAADGACFDEHGYACNGKPSDSSGALPRTCRLGLDALLFAPHIVVENAVKRAVVLGAA